MKNFIILDEILEDSQFPSGFYVNAPKVGKSVWPEGVDCQVREDMTVESVREACEKARAARVERFKL